MLLPAICISKYDPGAYLTIEYSSRLLIDQDHDVVQSVASPGQAPDSETSLTPVFLSSTCNPTIWSCTITIGLSQICIREHVKVTFTVHVLLQEAQSNNMLHTVRFLDAA